MIIDYLKKNGELRSLGPVLFNNIGLEAIQSTLESLILNLIPYAISFRRSFEKHFGITRNNVEINYIFENMRQLGEFKSLTSNPQAKIALFGFASTVRAIFRRFEKQYYENNYYYYFEEYACSQIISGSSRTNYFQKYFILLTVFILSTIILITVVIDYFNKSSTYVRALENNQLSIS